MKKLTVFLLVLASIVALVSCKVDNVDETLPQGVVGVNLSVDTHKAITMIVEDVVKKWEYRALPQFDLGEEVYNDGIFGEQYTWRELQVTNYKAVLGYYRQGLWVFELRTKNKNGEVLATGVSEPTYLQKGKDNLVRITLIQDDGEGRSGQNLSTGKVVFGFESNMLDASVYNIEHAYIRVEADKFDKNGVIETREGYHNLRIEQDNPTTGFTIVDHAFTSYLPGTTPPDDHNLLAGRPLPQDADISLRHGNLGATVQQARVRYFAETPDLELVEGTNTYIGEGGQQVEEEVSYYVNGVVAGHYILRILQCVKDEATGQEIIIAGQACAIKVVGGETTYVWGTLVPEKYIDTTLSITVPEGVEGNITLGGSSQQAGNKFEIRSDVLGSTSAIQLTFVPDNEELRQPGVILDYLWYIDGVLQTTDGANEPANDNTFVFAPTRYGDAKITCYVHGRVGQDVSFGAQSSVTQIVQVKPATGANITDHTTDPNF